MGLLLLLSVRRRIWIVCAILGACAGLALGVFTRPVYRAETSLVPSMKIAGRGQNASFASLQSAASQLGMGVGPGALDPSALFPKILLSRKLGREILEASYPSQSEGQVTLLDRLAPGGSDAAVRMDRALRRFHRKHLRQRFDRRSGVTFIGVELADPVMAAAVANALVERLDAFTRSARSAHAGREVAFITGRLGDVESSLRGAEEALKEFRLGNRQRTGSPQLLLQEARLARDVELNQQLFITLRSQLEIARIDEIADVPLISVIDRAVAPVRVHAPRRARLVALGLALGVGLGLLLILGLQLRESFARLLQGGPTGAGPA